MKQDVREAVKWYRLSANQGHAKAQCFLGRCYLHGQGVEHNVGEAVKWLRLSANQGDSNAQYYLGSCYEYG